jgi:hypothetical protein
MVEEWYKVVKGYKAFVFMELSAEVRCAKLERLMLKYYL